MIAVLIVIAIVGAVVFVQGFRTKAVLYFAFLPFQTWFQIHFPSTLWTAVVSGLLLLLVLAALSLRPQPGSSGRAAYGLTAVVVLYGGLAIAQAFNPDLPSVLLGLRGARLFVEPILLFFVGVELAKRPAVGRAVLITVIVTGTVVILYALKQGLIGFDGDEFAHYRRNFAIGAQERRVFSTMAGASVLGHYVTLVALLVAGVLLYTRTIRKYWPGLALLACAAYVIILTGQRGVLVSAAAAVAAAAAVGVSRLQWRARALYSAAVLSLLLGAVAALVVATPVEDRRAARLQSDNAFEAARVKLALLKTGGEETSLQLRMEHLENTFKALEVAPLGVGTGLSLVINPARSERITLLGSRGISEDFRPRVPPIAGESYYYTVATELGLLGIALFAAIGLFAVFTAGGIAVRDPNPAHAIVGLAGVGFFVMVLADSFTVDAMASHQVASYFWVLLGVLGRWAHDRDAGVEEARPATLATA